MTTVDETRRAAWSKMQADSDGRRGPLNPPPPGGTSGGMTDDALKPRVDFLHTAFLWLAGALVTALVTIVVLNLTLASSANVRTDRLIENISLINRQAGEQGTKMDEANRRLDRIEAKLDRLLDQRQK